MQPCAYRIESATEVVMMWSLVGLPIHPPAKDLLLFSDAQTINQASQPFSLTSNRPGVMGEFGAARQCHTLVMKRIVVTPAVLPTGRPWMAARQALGCPPSIGGRFRPAFSFLQPRNRPRPRPGPNQTLP